MVVINKGSRIPQKHTERHCMPQSDRAEQTESGFCNSPLLLKPRPQKLKFKINSLYPEYMNSVSQRDNTED